MRVHVVEGPQDIGQVGADVVQAAVESGQLHTLGVATGSSPMPVYRELARRGVGGLSSLRVFALDEYADLPLAHPQSYHSIVYRDVTAPLGLDPAAVTVPDTSQEDLAEAAEMFELRIIEAGGIDLQILGIGGNGHIGFNEPGSSLSGRTRVETLTPQTRFDNARFFSSIDEVPHRCITQGVGTILDARRILLVAHGRTKANAIARALEGPVTPECPASALQLHEDVTVVLDREAAQRLTVSSATV